eukprot:4186741-Amphidinium_carterae.1
MSCLRAQEPTATTLLWQQWWLPGALPRLCLQVHPHLPVHPRAPSPSSELHLTLRAPLDHVRLILHIDPTCWFNHTLHGHKWIFRFRGRSGAGGVHELSKHVRQQGLTTGSVGARGAPPPNLGYIVRFSIRSSSLILGIVGHTYTCPVLRHQPCNPTCGIGALVLCHSIHHSFFYQVRFHWLSSFDEHQLLIIARRSLPALPSLLKLCTFTHTGLVELPTSQVLRSTPIHTLHYSGSVLLDRIAIAPKHAGLWIALQ